MKREKILRDLQKERKYVELYLRALDSSIHEIESVVPPQDGQEPKRRGRPPGSKNKTSLEETIPKPTE